MDATIEVTESHTAQVGSMQVRRALPRRARRTVGAWCFADHMGPVAVEPDRGVDVAPHPHIGLQTVTWLVAGEILHRDGLGSEQVIRPGQLNLMTSGRGIAHSEEATGRYRGELQGIQLWVALPAAARGVEPAFEHHATLPAVDVASGTATVLVGELGGTASPARRHSDHVGIDLDLRRGRATLPVDQGHELAIVVVDGAVRVDGTAVTPGHLAFLGDGRDELTLDTDAPARLLLIGGVPYADELVMWWNFVGGTRQDILDAHRAWTDDDGRFATVASPLPRITVGAPPWPEASVSQRPA